MHNQRSGIRTLALVSVLLVLGCKRTATVEGDLTLAMSSGELRKGAGHTIYLVPQGDTVSQAVDRVCADWKAIAVEREKRARDFDAKAERFKTAMARATMQRGVALGDSVDKYRQAAAAERQTEDAISGYKDRLVNMLRSAADTQVQTDLDAHYRIENIAPGKYILYAEWPSDQDFYFLAPIDLGKGDDKIQNLDRATLANSKLRCQ